MGFHFGKKKKKQLSELTLAYLKEFFYLKEIGSVWFFVHFALLFSSDGHYPNKLFIYGRLYYNVTPWVVSPDERYIKQ